MGSSNLVGPTGFRVPLEQTVTRADRRKGLLQRDGLEGVFLIDRCRSVHTIGMRFALDVAFVSLDTPGPIDPTQPQDPSLPLEQSARTIGVSINRVISMPTNRFGLPRLGSNAVLEAEAGSFARWGLEPGQRWSIEP